MCDAKTRGDAKSVVVLLGVVVSCRVCSLNGGGSYKACRRLLRRVLVRWRIPVYQAVMMSPCSSSRLKRPSVCVRSCWSMVACWNKTKVHVAGVPLSSIRIDCRLVVPVGCDDDGCRCSSMERRHNLCFSSLRANEGSSLV